MLRCNLAIALLAGIVMSAGAVDLSIYDVQYTTDAGGASSYDGATINVVDGIVTHVWHGFNDRIYLQDPAHPTWGAIVVKDWTDDGPASTLAVGDLVRFDNVLVEEYRGTTFLQYDPDPNSPTNPSFTVESQGNAVPAPVTLTAADLINPVDHGVTEQYESMIATLENVTVGTMDLGKNADNYELLQNSTVAWAADYMNIDAGALYDPRIATGATFESITGIVEQYTKDTTWDYYQLCTRYASDIVVPEPTAFALVLLGIAISRHR
ncbi:MAG: hypothetical protein JXO22_18285 [Phycisphaerae bacterium]|nr:hypothetical protein [Phycisphaerae bacterium]